MMGKTKKLITLRNRVWEQLTEEERKAVLKFERLTAEELRRL